ncbi:MAG: TolC family protein [Thermodesulfovibrionales bacterium]
MKRLLPMIATVMLMVPCASGADEVIKKGELLTLERAVAIASERHPNISAGRSSIDAAQSRVGQARSGYYPQIGMSAGYSRVKQTVSSATQTPGSDTTLRSANGSFDQYSGSIALTQNLFDFGKTKAQVDVQSFNLEASRDDLSGITDVVVFNVKQSYFAILKAKRTRDVAEETVSQFVKHLDQAKGFFEVGTKPKFDVTKAEVDLSNAKLSLIKAENAQRVALVTLNNALGIPDAPEYLIEDNLSFQKYAITYDEALEKAYKNRPDLTALLARKSAAEKAVTLAEKGYYPFLTGNAGYNRTGESFPLNNGWSVGATLSFPIFSGFLTKNQVEEARANLNVIKANEETLRQNILLEVKQDYLALAEAEERIANAELTVRQATENLEIANGRYAAGVGNPIEVADAEVSLSNAKTEHIAALYDYRVGRASIEKAIGLR